MNQEEKIKALAEMFEVEVGAITPETLMVDLPWDSMAKLSLIALVNEEFSKKLSGKELQNLSNVQDVLDLMC